MLGWMNGMGWAACAGCPGPDQDRQDETADVRMKPSFRVRDAKPLVGWFPWPSCPPACADLESGGRAWLGLAVSGWPGPQCELLVVVGGNGMGHASQRVVAACVCVGGGQSLVLCFRLAPESNDWVR